MAVLTLDPSYAIRRLPASSSRVGRRYYQQMINGEECSSKQEQRYRVAEFLQSHHDPRFRTGVIKQKLLTLPGARWAFERDYLVKYPNTSFIGLEREPEIFSYSVRWMPGGERLSADLLCRDPLGHFMAVDAGQARLVHCHFSAYITSSFGTSDSNERSHNNRWRSFTGAWIDFTSQICEEHTTSLPWFPYSFHPACEQVPLAISVQASRDFPDVTAFIRSTGKSRSHYILELLRKNIHWSFRLYDSFTYLSDSTPMETALIVATNKSPSKLS